MTGPQAVSRSLSSVRQALVCANGFVEKHLGFHHITREDVVKHHTSPLAQQLLTDDPNAAILVLDGTYLYIQ
ncbi:unnamed protein product, partial [Didymodactylos carnosus]